MKNESAHQEDIMIPDVSRPVPRSTQKTIHNKHTQYPGNKRDRPGMGKGKSTVVFGDFNAATFHQELTELLDIKPVRTQKSHTARLASSLTMQ